MAGLDGGPEIIYKHIYIYPDTMLTMWRWVGGGARWC